MKTAVSVPDDVYQRAERLAKRERRSRSEVYSAALREYVARHDPDEVTEALDEALTNVGGAVDPFVARAGRHALESTDW
jgi:metal-responsive CopG/Arc/MetJ family transcriptional regulator